MYTLKSFAAEHSEELVEKFKREFEARHKGTRDIHRFAQADLASFIDHAIHWDSTTDGHKFWSNVACGYYITLDLAKTKQAPTDKCYCSARAKLYGGCVHCNPTIHTTKR